MSIAETFSLATDQLIPQSKPNVDTQVILIAKGLTWKILAQ